MGCIHLSQSKKSSKIKSQQPTIDSYKMVKQTSHQLNIKMAKQLKRQLQQIQAIAPPPQTINFRTSIIKDVGQQIRSQRNIKSLANSGHSFQSHKSISPPSNYVNKIQQKQDNSRTKLCYALKQCNMKRSNIINDISTCVNKANQLIQSIKSISQWKYNSKLIKMNEQLDQYVDKNKNMITYLQNSNKDSDDWMADLLSGTEQGTTEYFEKCFKQVQTWGYQIDNQWKPLFQQDKKQMDKHLVDIREMKNNKRSF